MLAGASCCRARVLYDFEQECSCLASTPRTRSALAARYRPRSSSIAMPRRRCSQAGERGQQLAAGGPAKVGDRLDASAPRRRFIAARDAAGVRRSASTPPPHRWSRSCPVYSIPSR